MAKSRIPRTLRELWRKPIEEVSDEQLRQELCLWQHVEVASGGTLTEEEKNRQKLVEQALQSRQKNKE